MSSRKRRVQVINTGGTIGMVHEDGNPLNPLKPGNWKEITENYPVLTQLEEANGIEMDVVTFNPLLDSANITYQDWKHMALAIREGYKKFDGFVILHGTDTMCYTASALSFMLEQLEKPVILTGSQLPLAKPRSDALENLVTSLCIAAGVDVSDGTALPVVPEVCILFRGKLLRGNRSRKLSSVAYAGFESPNYPTLGKAEEHIRIEENLIRPVPKRGEERSDEPLMFVSEKLMTDVMALDIFPGLDTEILKRAVIGSNNSGHPIRGLVLKTFGAGNAPNDERFLNAIGEIVDSGVLVVDVTQCPQGMVEIGYYETSARLLDKGVISGLDMTPEAALCKLMWLFGKGNKFEQVARLMQIDQRGEQSMNIFNVNYGEGRADPVFNGNMELPGQMSLRNVTRATLRFQNAQFISEQGENKTMQLKVYVAEPSVEVSTPTEGKEKYAGKCEKALANRKDKATLLLDVASKVKRFYTAGQPGLLGVVASEGDAIKWEKLNLALYEDVKAK